MHAVLDSLEFAELALLNHRTIDSCDARIVIIVIIILIIIVIVIVILIVIIIITITIRIIPGKRISPPSKATSLWRLSWKIWLGALLMNCAT